MSNKIKTVSVYETDLISGQKNIVEIQIEDRTGYANTDKKEEGDIFLSNGIIKYINKNIPEFMFRNNYAKKHIKKVYSYN